MATTDLPSRFTGPLSTERLSDAVRFAEENEQEPTVLVVGSRELEKQAHEILSESRAGVGRLRESFPRLIVDDGLGDGWNLARFDGDRLVEAAGYVE